MQALVCVGFGVRILLVWRLAGGGEYEAEVAIEREVELGLERLVAFQFDPDGAALFRKGARRIGFG